MHKGFLYMIDVLFVLLAVLAISTHAYGMTVAIVVGIILAYVGLYKMKGKGWQQIAILALSAFLVLAPAIVLGFTDIRF